MGGERNPAAWGVQGRVESVCRGELVPGKVNNTRTEAGRSGSPKRADTVADSGSAEAAVKEKLGKKAGADRQTMDPACRSEEQEFSS